MKKVIIVALISLFSNVVISQSEIGLNGGLLLGYHFSSESNNRSRVEMNPKLSYGYNVSLFYQKNIKNDLSLRGQILMSSFQKSFKAFSGGKVFTSTSTGEINVAEISFGVLPVIKIAQKPEIQFGIGISYITQRGDPDMNIIITASDFSNGVSIVTEKTIKQSEFINQNGLGLLMNLEVKIPLDTNLKLITGINIQQRVTSFVKKETSASKVYTGMISYGIGLVFEL